MHQPQHLAYDHGIRIQLFRLLLRLARGQVGPIVEYVFVYSEADAIGPVSAQRWHNRCRFQLLRIAPSQLTHDRGLLILLL